jgi:SAM-dependent methyltransferase
MSESMGSMQGGTSRRVVRRWPPAYVTAMIESASPVTLKGTRDRAALALMLAAGMSRRTTAELTFERLRRHRGRWYAADVPIAGWIKDLIDRWALVANLKRGYVFRAVNRGDRTIGPSLSPQSAFALVELYAYRCGLHLAPYVPSREPLVDVMLGLADLGERDVLYDLGSGDGRIPIAAAHRYGCRAVGVEINPERIREATERLGRYGTSLRRVEFVQADLLRVNLRRATAITLFLVQPMNMRLAPKLRALRSGVRIVSHRFGLGAWRPDRVVRVDGDPVYKWTVR